MFFGCGISCARQTPPAEAWDSAPTCIPRRIRCRSASGPKCWSKSTKGMQTLSPPCRSAASTPPLRCLLAAVMQNTPQFHMTAALRKRVKPESGEDAEQVVARERSQLRHQATVCSSIVARIVGSGLIPASAKSSPSRCSAIASRMLTVSSSRVGASVTTGRSRHSATYCCSPRGKCGLE